MRRVGGIFILAGLLGAAAFATTLTLSGQAGGRGAARGGATTAKPYTTWRQYAGSSSSSQYSALDQINKTNVSKLQVAWSYPITGNSIFNPIIVDNTMYVSVGGGGIAALDAATGKEIWSKTVGGLGARGINYWESADRSDRRLVFLSGGAVTEVNAQTGDPITNFGNNGKVDLRDAQDRRSTGSLQTSNPGRIFENLYIVSLPAGGASYGATPADVHAYDILTGKLAWVFHTIPAPGEFGADTWPAGNPRETHGGGHNWSEFTVDAENGIAFVNFGSPRFDFYGGDRKGNNLFGNSLVAIDARTGKRLWHYQLIHHDLWDYDIPQSAKLLTIRQNGRDRQIVAQATKHGFLFVFDRKTGEPIWPINEKPVPQTDVPGEWTSPTQPFPSKPEPYAQQSFTEKDINPYLPKETQDQLRAQMRTYRNQGLFTPPSIEGTIEMPGHNGGANFGTSAVDPTKGEFYVVHKSLPVITRITMPRAPRGGGAGGAGGGGRGGGGAAAGGGGRGGGGGGVCGDTGPISPEQKAMLTAQAKELIANANGQRVEFDSPVAFMNCNFPGGAMVAVKPPWSELVKYDLNTGDVKWRVPVGVQEAPAEFGIPKTTGVQFPRDAPVVTAGGLIFLGAGPEKKVHAYDRDNGKELWQYKLENGTEGMPAVYEVNGKQFVVFPVAQPTGTFPASFTNAAAPAPIAAAGAGGGRAAGAAAGLPPGQANAAAAAGAAPEAAAVAAAAGGSQGGRGGRGGRGGGGPQLPSAYIAFALP